MLCLLIGTTNKVIFYYSSRKQQQEQKYILPLQLWWNKLFSIKKKRIISSFIIECNAHISSISVFPRMPFPHKLTFLSNHFIWCFYFKLLVVDDITITIRFWLLLLLILVMICSSTKNQCELFLLGNGHPPSKRTIRRCWIFFFVVVFFFIFYCCSTRLF